MGQHKRELKAFALTAADKPGKEDRVSTTVEVRNEEGKTGYCYIRFSPAFVERVGFALRFGVSKDNPARIKVYFYPNTKVWLVQAQYLHDSEPALLWSTPQKPSWLRFHTRALKNASTKATHPHQPSCQAPTARDREGRGAKS